jgi:ABC-type dipeptide/oligopeptide/nickel transport system permease component
MLRFVVRRLLLLIPILIGLSILVFFWIRALPGSPATALLGERATAEQIEAINEQYGLNDPIWEQYWRYVQSLLEFDFGQSVTTRRPVLDEFLELFPATIELAVAAMFFSIVVGIRSASWPRSATGASSTTSASSPRCSGSRSRSSCWRSSSSTCSPCGSAGSRPSGGSAS